MFEFLEYIKQYLADCFNADPDFMATKKPEVYDSYKVGHSPKNTKPEVQVQIMDNSEQTRYTTFCGIRAENLPLQFMAFSGAVRIAGVERNAQQASIILADKTKGYINDLIYGNKENNILTGNHIISATPLPMNDGGTIYMTPVRFNFTIQTRV